MDGTEFVVPQLKSDRDETIQRTVEATLKRVSCAAGDLVSAAEAGTRTKAEYSAFMRGAAFMFYKVCERGGGRRYAPEAGFTSSPEEAVRHVYSMLPFMTDDERKEHLALAGWLNELIERRGGKRIPLPDDFSDGESLQHYY